MWPADTGSGRDTFNEPGLAPAVLGESAYAAKAKAYQEAAKVVDEARKTETNSQSVLNSFLSGFVEKLPFTISDFATGLAGAVAAQTSKFRQLAAGYSAKAARAANLMHSPHLSFANQTRAAIIHAQNSVNAADTTRRATATRVARLVDALPGWTKSFLQAPLSTGIKPTTPVLSRALPVLKRVPWAGTLITAAGIGYDISQGKNAVQSTASGLGSLAAGAAVGAAIGGPVGVVVGGIVGVGVGFVIDEWGDDIAKGAGEAAEWVGNKVSEGTKKVGKFIGDLF